MKISTNPERPAITQCSAAEFAASACRDALVELLVERKLHEARPIPAPPGTANKQGEAIRFEVGFGSPGIEFFEPAIRLESIAKLFAGEILHDVPIMIPRGVTRSPLEAALAHSFPLLLRGTIDITELSPYMTSLAAANLRDHRPYHEARVNLTAAHIREITLCRPSVAQASEYHGAVQHQWENKVQKLQQMFLGDVRL